MDSSVAPIRGCSPLCLPYQSAHRFPDCFVRSTSLLQDARQMLPLFVRWPLPGSTFNKRHPQWLLFSSVICRCQTQVSRPSLKFLAQRMSCMGEIWRWLTFLANLMSENSTGCGSIIDSATPHIISTIKILEFDAASDYCLKSAGS